MKHKRNKRSRLRGRKTCGYGSRKKHRGKGSRGGKGMAGTGKRAGHLRTFLLKYYPDYFGKYGFYRKGQETKMINIDDIQEKIPYFIEKGIAKRTSSGIEIDLKEYKILGKGRVKEKFIIDAKSASEQAMKKISAIGGKIKIGMKKDEKESKQDKKTIIKK